MTAKPVTKFVDLVGYLLVMLSVYVFIYLTFRWQMKIKLTFPFLLIAGVTLWTLKVRE